MDRNFDDDGNLIEPRARRRRTRDYLPVRDLGINCPSCGVACSGREIGVVSERASRYLDLPVGSHACTGCLAPY